MTRSRPQLNPVLSQANEWNVGDSTPIAAILNALQRLELKVDTLAAKQHAAIAAPFPANPAHAELLRAIYDYCGDRLFSARAVVAHAQNVRALETSIVAAIGVLNARALG